MFDIVIRRGRVVDGTGRVSLRADIGIAGGKIMKVGNLGRAEAETTIDAKDLIVSPGFIDMHGHADLQLLEEPHNQAKIRQGITTEVIGSCGFSIAPYNKANLALLKEYGSPILGESDLNWDWPTFGRYLSQLEKQGTVTNVIPFVGQGAIRIAVMGMDDRPATPSELKEMKALVALAMDEGSFGMSTGLIYPPGIYTKTDEIIELTKVVALDGGIYSSHIRGEGKTLIAALKEAIEIAEGAEIPLEISHLKAVGEENWNKIDEVLELIFEARERGIDVTYDQYPYLAGSTSLVTLLPPWAREGGVSRVIDRLENLKVRKQIEEDISDVSPRWENFVQSCGWEKICICSVSLEKNKKFVGKNIAEIARLEGKSPADIIFDLLIEEHCSVSMLFFAMSEEVMTELLKQDIAMIGTDGLYGNNTHPRLYGTFPHILSRYVREKKVLSLEQAVCKMTFLPAQKFGLNKRGQVKEGNYADITIFNPETVLDKATYEEPFKYPEGIEYVIVNGRIVVEKGSYEKGLFGKVIERKEN